MVSITYACLFANQGMGTSMRTAADELIRTSWLRLTWSSIMSFSNGETSKVILWSSVTFSPSIIFLHGTYRNMGQRLHFKPWPALQPCTMKYILNISPFNKYHLFRNPTSKYINKLLFISAETSIRQTVCAPFHGFSSGTRAVFRIGTALLFS